ncbi:hypothetical protein VNO77_32468 [Canavalia gladiata]|uniref:Uncharacterized protein n=1 Tax=Canavalia gladiata TaxID=3824 RepID=A0AAN9Q480_CANGL
MRDSEVHVTALLETLIDFQLILYTYITISKFRFTLPICTTSRPIIIQECNQLLIPSQTNVEDFFCRLV